MDKEEKLLLAFVELRRRYTMEVLALFFSAKKAWAFESLRMKFHNAVEVI